MEVSAAYESGDYGTAASLISEIASTTTDPSVYGFRGNCHSYNGDLAAALEDYGNAIRLCIGKHRSALPSIYYNRGVAYARAGEFEPAISDYEQTISIDDAYPDVRNNLAWILATCPSIALRDPTRAISLIEVEQARGKEHDHALLDTLAAAHAASGDFQSAIDQQSLAIENTSDEAKVTKYRDRLELYRIGRPFVTPK